MMLLVVLQTAILGDDRNLAMSLRRYHSDGFKWRVSTLNLFVLAINGLQQAITDSLMSAYVISVEGGGLRRYPLPRCEVQLMSLV